MASETFQYFRFHMRIEFRHFLFQELHKGRLKIALLMQFFNDACQSIESLVQLLPDLMGYERNVAR